MKKLDKSVCENKTLFRAGKRSHLSALEARSKNGEEEEERQLEEKRGALRTARLGLTKSFGITLPVTEFQYEHGFRGGNGAGVRGHVSLATKEDRNG